MKAIIVKFFEPVDDSSYVLFSTPSLDIIHVIDSIDTLADPSNTGYRFLRKSDFQNLKVPQHILKTYGVDDAKELADYCYNNEYCEFVLDYTCLEKQLKDLYENSKYKEHFIV
jgi:hypothetical protein